MLSTENNRQALLSSKLHPACRVTPDSATKVAKAVKYLASKKCQFAIRSGGHTPWAGGRTLCFLSGGSQTLKKIISAANIGSNGVTIDLSALNAVQVSTDQSVASIGPGARWKDVYLKLDSLGIAVSGGRVSSVGVGGLTMGGGKSFFASKVGFVCDNIINFELVTAAGNVLQVNGTSNPRLYKALKGGNNNFGIVTRFDAKTFPQGNLWAGQVVYPNTTRTQQLEALYYFTETTGANLNPSGDAQIIFAYVTTATEKFYANFYSYTLPDPYPAQFKNFTNIKPELENSLQVSNLTTFAIALNEGTPNGQQYIFGTMTFKNNLGFLRELQDFSDENFAALVASKVSDLEISFVLQPLTKPMLDSGCNKNSLGLCPKDGNLIILDLTISWTDASANRAVDKAAKLLIDGATSRAKKRGLLNEYIYLNYALESQDPISSYGSANVKAMEAASHEKPRPNNTSLAQLSTLVEREETPERGVSTLLDAIASPQKNNESSIPRPNHLHTPSSVGKIRPESAEMHPSHYQTTVKKAASASNHVDSSKEKTPTGRNATHSRPSMPFSSPSFEFRFTRPSTDLSTEAKRMMDEVREQAARIKGELATQREDGVTSGGSYNKPGRKIAQPKGKAGRFSDVHMESFKKMDSIANHPSSFRADTSRFPEPQRSLKRSNSKAGLDKSDHSTNKPTLVNTAKKQKANASESDDDKRLMHATSTPNIMRVKSQIPTMTSATTSTVTTPTKASLARSASVKSLKTGSMIPSLKRTPSTKTLATPTVQKAAISQSERKPSFTEKLQNVKSILRHPRVKFSDDPLKIAAGTHKAFPRGDQSLTTPHRDKPLPDLPNGSPGTPNNRMEKHVGFSPSPIIIGNADSGPPASPSPMKRAVGPPSVLYPSLDAADVTRSPPSEGRIRQVRASVPGPGDFSFQPDQAITFAKPTDAQTTPTIRKVRPSNAGSIAVTSPSKLSSMPNVPHGLANKKRKRDSEEAPDSTEDKENTHGSAESPAKRARVDQAPSLPCTPQGRVKATPSRRLPQSTGAKARGILSLSRLNALARPKDRN
ncbi:MAG: hypothetical protein M1828_001911 [Chrysothrix sp. TS-e1954]|nr:MAG: hypothetical protein M1828_001911 [Chrysothrix sp. TS-e1954]